MEPGVPGSSPGGGTIRSGSFRSAHARYAAHAAAALGYAFRSLDGDDGYLFEVRDGARRGLFAGGAGTPYALNDARAAALARDKAFTAEALREAGVAVLPGRMFFVTKQWAEMRGLGREPEDALAYAETARFPLFCKPIAGSNGLFAEVIADRAAFADYIARVAQAHFAILAQPFVRGVEHRVFVLDGAALFSYQKQLPQIVGNGVRPARELIAALKRDTMGCIETASVRGEDGAMIALDAILPAGARAHLEGPANRAAGGSVTGLRAGAPEPLASLALQAAGALGLRLAAVDMFDVSPQRDGGECVVIEVNSNPMIATLEDHARWDLITEIWRANFDAALR